MSPTDKDEWRPNWTEADIAKAKSEIFAALLSPAYKEFLENDGKKCAGAAVRTLLWLKCEQAADHKARVERLVDDAPRVLGIIATHWDVYIQRVWRQRDESQRAEIINNAKDSPARLFILLTDVVFRYWEWFGGQGYESSAGSVWNKIGWDNQLLWPNSSLFAKVFSLV